MLSSNSRQTLRNVKIPVVGDDYNGKTFIKYKASDIIKILNAPTVTQILANTSKGQNLQNRKLQCRKKYDEQRRQKHEIKLKIRSIQEHQLEQKSTIYHQNARNSLSQLRDQFQDKSIDQPSHPSLSLKAMNPLQDPLRVFAQNYIKIKLSKESDVQK